MTEFFDRVEVTDHLMEVLPTEQPVRDRQRGGRHRQVPFVRHMGHRLLTGWRPR